MYVVTPPKMIALEEAAGPPGACIPAMYQLPTSFKYSRPNDHRPAVEKHYHAKS
jgi:hypothetical protein